MKNPFLRFVHLGFATLLLLVSVAARQAPVLPTEPKAATHKSQQPKGPPVLRELSPMTAAPVWHVAFVQDEHLVPPPVLAWLVPPGIRPLPRPAQAFLLHYREVLFEHFLSTNGP